MSRRNDKILKLPEAALWLRVSYMTARRLVAAGEIPAFKVGAQWRVWEGDLVDYCNEQRRRHADVPRAPEELAELKPVELAPSALAEMRKR